MLQYPAIDVWTSIVYGVATLKLSYLLQREFLHILVHIFVSDSTIRAREFWFMSQANTSIDGFCLNLIIPFQQ